MIFPEEVKEFFRQAFDKPEAASGLLETFRLSTYGDKLQEYFVQLQGFSFRDKKPRWMSCLKA
jgi:hypothetical protein